MMLGLLAFLPLVPLVLLAERRLGNWRAATVTGFLVWSALAYGLGETLGAFSLLNHGAVLCAWLLANGVLYYSAARALRKANSNPSPIFPRGFGAAVLVGLVVLLALTLARVLLSPPNTPDALSYHLPRQLMWLQQGNLEFFPTRNDRLLMMPPLAEVLQVHAMALSGGDAWAGLPQWLAYVVGMVVTSLLIREIGGRKNAQWLGALLFAVLPMAYHQASSAKNDLLLAVYIACALWLMLRSRRFPAKLLGWVGLGLAAGLGLATKSTAALWLLPVALVLMTAAWRHRRMAVWALALAVLIPAPHAIRNMNWYGTPLGIHRAEDGGAQACEVISWRAGVSNAVRNMGLHLVSPWPECNQILDSSIAHIHRWIGADPQDRRTTLWTLPYELIWAPSFELVAGAPFHVLAGMLCLLALALRWKRLRPACHRVVLILLVEVLLYCLTLKWQQWGARLQLPHFIMLAALSALIMGEGRTMKAVLWSILMVIFWLPFADMRERPLFSSSPIWSSSRWENYFRSFPPERQAQESCMAVLSATGAKTVLVDNVHASLYPLMMRLKTERGTQFQMGELREGSKGELPQAIISYPGETRAPLYLDLARTRERYRAVGDTKLWIVYLPESQARSLKNLGTPEFIGWTSVRGLGVWEGITFHGSTSLFREIPDEGAVLNYEARGKRLRLQLGILNLGGPSLLAVFHSGTNIAQLPITVSPNWQYAEIPFDAASGAERRIALKPVLVGDSKGKTRLHMVRLRVVEEISSEH